MRLLRAAAITTVLLGSGLSVLAAPSAAPPGDVGGITLGELFREPVRVFSRAEQSLDNSACLSREFHADGVQGCDAGAFYEAALLIEFCGRGGGPLEILFPRRLQGWGVTDLSVWNAARRERQLQERRRAFIRQRCGPLGDTLLALPSMADPRTGGCVELSARTLQVAFLRLHAALLGDTRALRWIVEDWQVAEGHTPGYVPFQAIEAAVQHIRGRLPVQWHRLAYQVESQRPPDFVRMRLRKEMDEARLIEAAAHLLVWRRVAEPYFDQPADLRWMHLHEHHFLRRLTGNQMSLAIHRANEMLAGRPIEPRRPAGESATPPGLPAP